MNSSIGRDEEHLEYEHPKHIIVYKDSQILH